MSSISFVKRTDNEEQRNYGSTGGSYVYNSSKGSYKSQPGKTPVFTPSGADMSRNTALANTTTYDNGYNVTRDENGYAKSAYNVDQVTELQNKYGSSGPSPATVTPTPAPAPESVPVSTPTPTPEPEPAPAPTPAPTPTPTPAPDTTTTTSKVSTSTRPSYDNYLWRRVQSKLNQILDREGFRYDLGSDPLYGTLKQQYNREGDRAMQDTLAAAASGAGGMNSYAITAAQQANDYYSAQLMDRVPELYQMAYEMYLDDIDRQVKELGLLQQMDSTQYNRYRNTMSDWENDRNFAYQQYRDDVADNKWQTEFDYGVKRDQIADQQWQALFDYNAIRDQVADNQWQTQFEYGASRDQIDDSQWEAQLGYEALRDIISDGRYNQEWDYNVSQDEKEWDYNTSQSEKQMAYDRAMTLLSYGQMPDSDTLTRAGISASEAQKILNGVAAKAVKKTYSGGGSTSSTKKNSAAYSSVDKKAASLLKSDGMEAATAYLNNMVDGGYVTEDEAVYIYEVSLGGVSKPEVEEQPPKNYEELVSRTGRTGFMNAGEFEEAKAFGIGDAARYADYLDYLRAMYEQYA